MLPCFFSINCAIFIASFILSPTCFFPRLPPCGDPYHGRAVCGCRREALEASALGMSSQLQLSVILTTFERPAHLERSLLSLAQQRSMAGKFEVIVSDDGSTDDTRELVQRFA